MKNLTPIIFIVLAIGIFFVVVDPQYQEIQKLLEVKEDNDKLLSKATELREKREVLTSKYKNISEEERDQLNKVLPETVDNVRLILDIDNIARKYGIILKGITISGGLEEAGSESNQIIDKTDKQYGVISLGFSFSSSYADFKSFMIDLENSLRIVDITAFEINSDNPQNGLYNYSIDLNTYWLR